MKIFGFEKLSLLDYEKKLACVIFTGGCNFRCPFCHNSSLVYTVPSSPTIDEKEIFDYISLRKNMLDAVTITGGEPTLQRDLRDFLEKLRQTKLLIKLDTNGTDSVCLNSLISDGLIDYVAMDIKNSLEKYPQTAGVKRVDIKEIEASIDILLNSSIEYEFRTTLVKEFHTESDMEAISLRLKGAKRYFLQKFVENENCIQKGFHEVEKQNAEAFKEILSKTIPFVRLRGY